MIELIDNLSKISENYWQVFKNEMKLDQIDWVEMEWEWIEQNGNGVKMSENWLEIIKNRVKIDWKVGGKFIENSLKRSENWLN